MDQLRFVLLLGLLCSLLGCRKDDDRPNAFVSSKMVMDLSEEGQERVQEVLAEHCGTPGQVKLLGDTEGAYTDELILGEKVFERRCVPCHGYSGDGAGPAAEYLWPRPRDYREGVFKFTSTNPGTLVRPTRDDIRRVIVEGAPGTAMPSFRLLPEEEIDALVTYVLALTHRGELEILLASDFDGNGELSPEMIQDEIDYVLESWANEQARILEPQWSANKGYTVENILKGREFFMDNTSGCVKCHGPDGRGSQVGEVGTDHWGHTSAAADLTTGLFHGGGRPEDIYRRILAGIKGSPMPNFSGEAALGNDPETVWNLAHYVRYLADQARREVAAEQLERQRQQASGLLNDEAGPSGTDATSEDGG